MNQSENIVFYCKGCEQMVFATSNRPGDIDADTRKEISGMLKRGHKMATVTTAVVRRDFGGCTCNEEKQRDLFAHNQPHG